MVHGVSVCSVLEKPFSCIVPADKSQQMEEGSRGNQSILGEEQDGIWIMGWEIRRLEIGIYYIFLLVGLSGASLSSEELQHSSLLQITH